MTYTPAQLQERTLYRRAIEAAIWGIPAVNYDAMYQALVRDAQGGSNQVVYWSRLLDWKNQTLTPNPDAIYLMPFYDTTNGPVVLGWPRRRKRREVPHLAYRLSGLRSRRTPIGRRVRGDISATHCCGPT